MQLNQFLSNNEHNNTNQFTIKSIHSKGLLDDLGEDKTKAYLKALQEQNKVLINKIKQYDEKLKAQVEIMNKKIVSPVKKRFVVPKFSEMETEELKNKFEQFQKLRKYIYLKKEGNESVQFLQLMKEEQMNKLRVLKEQIQFKKNKIQNLKKIELKSQKQQNRTKLQIQKLGAYNFYDAQISQLKTKVKLKKDSLVNKKEQLFSVNKSRINKSTNNVISSLSLSPDQRQLPAQVLQLKRQYELLGKKIDALKIKKINLQKGLKRQNNYKGEVQKIRYKYENLIKGKK